MSDDTQNMQKKYASKTANAPTLMKRATLAQKIVLSNLVVIVLMMLGLLYLDPFREGLVKQRESGLISEAALISSFVAMSTGGDGKLGTHIGDAQKLSHVFKLPLHERIYVFDLNAKMIASSATRNQQVQSSQELGRERNQETLHVSLEAFALRVLEDEVQIRRYMNLETGSLFVVAMPVLVQSETGHSEAIGVVALVSEEGEIDRLVGMERRQILAIFSLSIVMSIALSLILARTIATPLAQLAVAADVGREKNRQKLTSGRVRIPDLSERPDEIGRLSVALRGMVSALYDRIDANEQFAADVAHEIKNPLASLRSAIGSLRIVKKEEHRDTLLDVIEHDVRRLDRLVSDISNASRLDSELVKEEEETFDLLKMLANLTEYLSQEATRKDIEFICDLPDDVIAISGLEARLAQVFVNLLTNAISFCEAGDAIRLWVRKRDARVLIVVEDTGPGIPDEALLKVFDRFYSERPEIQFGEHSGLGLAISKQIVEAHGGVVWAENIRPTQADITSEPFGARFVVGLPIDDV